MINLTMAKFNAKNPQTGEFEPLDGASLARVQSDWNESDNTAEDFIKNKPNLGAAASKNVDQTPTLLSPNLVESNGVAAALSAKADLENGKIPISQIPSAAVERMRVVADDAARFALTTDTVQNGDTVKVTSTNKMYLVVDNSKLNSEAGYQVYVAGMAAEAVADQNGNTINTTYETKNDAASIAAIGTCETAGNVAEKVVIMPAGWTLRTGSIIGVRFTNTNTASNVSLNVGGSGAKRIKNGTSENSQRMLYTGIAGYTIFYMYDGANWVWISQSTSPNQVSEAEIDAGTSTGDRFISAQRLKYATDKATENVVGINSSDDDYIEMKSGVRLYITNTTPTDTIPTGSIGIGF